MFSKKCNRCGKKVNSKNNYCPSCGNRLNSKEKKDEWGMLGTNDFKEDMFSEIKLPKGLDMVLNGLMKNLDKQFKDFDKQINSKDSVPKENPNPFIKKGGISISISTSNGKSPEIKVRSFGNNEKLKKAEQNLKKQVKKQLPSNSKNISKLQKAEPSTNVRRLSDKVVYEINLPGVKSMKDISINQLENSIEIKAIAGDKAYIKLIPISLPILDYNLSRGKLILELENKN